MYLVIIHLFNRLSMQTILLNDKKRPLFVHFYSLSIDSFSIDSLSLKPNSSSNKTNFIIR